MQIIVSVIALAFAIMGLAALISPARIPAIFGVGSITVDMANEIRAVYGGFGCAIAGLLVASFIYPSLERGILLTVSIALFGMALGRGVSWAIDRTIGGYPLLFLGIEIVSAGALLYVFIGQSIVRPV